jgi:hypothetical protein
MLKQTLLLLLLPLHAGNLLRVTPSWLKWHACSSSGWTSWHSDTPRRRVSGCVTSHTAAQGSAS